MTDKKALQESRRCGRKSSVIHHQEWLPPWAGRRRFPDRRCRLDLEPLEARALLSFAAPLRLPAGASPFAIIASDLNGDQRADLAVVNRGDNTVSVFLNRGGGTFQLGQKLTTSGRPSFHPHALAVGDLNGDGIPDLVVANMEKGSVSVFLGRGDGTFSPPADFAAADFPPGSAPVSVAIADVTGDGRLDVIVADQAGTLNLLKGRGDGTLGSPQVVARLPVPIFVATADLNHDGKPDLVAVSEGDINGVGGRVEVFLGRNDGSFSPAQSYATGVFPYAVAIADLNGDGILDLAVANFASNSVSILLGVGDGTFKPLGEFPTGRTPHDVVAGDFEGDGRPDLVTANFNDGHVSLLRGNGDGTFQGPRSIPAGANSAALATADFNADGRLDLAVADDDGNAAIVLINQPTDNGSFVTQVYRDFLNRDPDPPGFASFTTLLDRGLANRFQVAGAVLQSEEYHTLLIQQLYQELLRRVPDPAGLTGWRRYLDDGGTQDGLRASLLGSEEYFQRRGGGTTQGFLSALYRDLLGRTIDPSGARAWSEALEEGDSSRMTVAAGIVGSREGAQLTVNDLYFRLLHRAPDPVGFKASLSALQQGVTAELLIITIVGSDEYFNAP